MASQDIVIILSKDDIVACAKEIGIPEAAITDDVLRRIKHGVQSALVGGTEIVKAAQIRVPKTASGPIVPVANC